MIKAWLAPLGWATEKATTSKQSLEVETPVKSFIRILTTGTMSKWNTWPWLTSCWLDKTLTCTLKDLLKWLIWQMIQLLKMGKLSLLNGKTDFNGHNKLVLTQNKQNKLVLLALCPGCSIPSLEVPCVVYCHKDLCSLAVNRTGEYGSTYIPSSASPQALK